MIAALIAASTAKLAAAGTTAAAATTAEAAAAAAAAKAAAAATTATAGTTAALEAAKQTAIQNGIQNVGAEAAKSAGVEVAKQAGTEAATQNVVREGIMSGTKQAGTEAVTQNVGQEVAKEGIDQATQQAIQNGQGGLDAYGQFTQAPGSIDPAANSGIASKPYVNAPPTPGTPGTPVDINAGLEKGIDYMEMPGVDVPHAGETATGLQKGFESAMKFAKDNPMATMVGMQGLGSLMNSNSGSSGPPKKTYSRKGDMSGFKSSEPSTIEYNPIFQPTPYAGGGIASYAVGGEVEQMSAQNALSSNQMYPQSQLQTPMYSNPMAQRPIQNNVINTGIDAPVDPYSGEQVLSLIHI